jgi:SAM-dependent methyltransferase
MISELVRIHHAEYKDDLPFWIGYTEGLEPILEIGCGHGRVTLPLLAAGRTMVGIDRDSDSLAYIEEVLEEFKGEIRQRISLILTDILTFQAEEPFGGVIIPCNTYSTFNGMNRPRLLKKINSYLKDDGVLIISIPNPQQMEEIIAALCEMDQIEGTDLETVITHPRSGYPVQVSSCIRTAGESLSWDWIYDHLQPNGEVDRAVTTVEHFLVSQEEIMAELEQGGFSDVLCLGDFSGGEYHQSSPYLILICRK